MKKLSLIFLTQALFWSAIIATPLDPFAPQGNLKWQSEGLKEKPYRLEIAYGETEQDLPTDEKTQMRLVNAAFLESATRLTMATSSEEIGELEKHDDFIIKYKISGLHDGNFKLTIHFASFEGIRTREINSDLTLMLSDWVVLGGLTRDKSDGQKMTYSIAIRLTKRAN